MTEPVAISLVVNGQTHDLVVPPRKTLADVIREDVGLTGTHVGCEHGVCGACTILIDGAPARACLTYAVQMEGHDLTTVEAMSEGDRLSPLQRALTEAHGLQCGFCTPGIVVTFEAWLRDNPDPDEVDVRKTLSGNTCRCTGYQSIVEAILAAAAEMRGEGGR